MSTSNTVELVKESTDIVTVVERYVKLKKAGKNYTGLCPFHNEKTPSFNVSPDIQIFKCFGCGKTGDVLTFVQEIEKIDFREALEKLAKDAGIKLESRETESPYKLFYDLNFLASEIYLRLLRNNKNALEYIKSRGFTDEDITKFRIGYAPTNNIVHQKVTEKFKLTSKQKENCGLFVHRNGRFVDKFKDRIIFPITSHNGKIIGFTGRLTPQNTYGPKYMNSPETPVFIKSKNVYGLYQSKPSIRKEDLCIMCEGTTDVISSHRVGVSNIVAPLGTSVTLDQLKIVSQFTKNILFIFDNDLAGRNALERVFELCEKLDITSFAASTEPFKDIDELIVAEPERLPILIKEKKTDLFSFLLSRYIESHDTTNLESHVSLEKYIHTLLSKVSSKNRLDFYQSKASQISPSFTLGKTTFLKTSKEAKGSNQERDLTFEELYLKALLQAENIHIPTGHDLDSFQNKKVRYILEIISDSSTIVTKLLHRKLEINMQNYLGEIALSKEIVNFEDAEKLYGRILYNNLVSELNDQRSKLAAYENLKDNEKAEKVFERINYIMNKLNDLKK